MPKPPSILRRLGLSIGAAAVLFALAPAAGAVDLTPHRALYNMSLASATRGSGVASATGTMLYSFSYTCDAWASETNVDLKLVYAENGEVDTNWSFASWEAKDGRSYQYRVRHTRDGMVVEDLKGTVRRDGPTDAAKARFTSPEDKVIDLPEGTLFPTRHLVDMISLAESGKPVFNRTVFDGASLDNPYEVNAITTRDTMADTPKAKEAETLIAEAGFDDKPIRHVRLAFFGLRSKAPEPEFELGIDYRSDGIARTIRQDFGDFVVDLVPESVEKLDRPDC